MEQERQTSGRGGKREGAGRPKGAIQKTPKKEYETTFQVRCSYKQADKLKTYWQTIKYED